MPVDLYSELEEQYTENIYLYLELVYFYKESVDLYSQPADHYTEHVYLYSELVYYY